MLKRLTTVNPGITQESRVQWRNRLTGGPWTNYIKGPTPHFEFTEGFIIIKVLTEITIKHKKIDCSL